MRTKEVVKPDGSKVVLYDVDGLGNGTYTHTNIEDMKLKNGTLLGEGVTTYIGHQKKYGHYVIDDAVVEFPTADEKKVATLMFEVVAEITTVLAWDGVKIEPLLGKCAKQHTTSFDAESPPPERVAMVDMIVLSKRKGSKPGKVTKQGIDNTTDTLDGTALDNHVAMLQSVLAKATAKQQAD